MTEEKENVNALENLNEEQCATGVEYLWAQNISGRRTSGCQCL
jgi:hypothetical protein